MTQERPFRIHFVCTGNVCRSAFAAAYLGSRLAAIDPGAFAVTSSGTGWHEDLRVPRQIHALAEVHGVSMGGHRGRYAVEEDFRAADVILAATREHRRDVLRQTPEAMKRTFTMREFASLLHFLGTRPGTDPQAWRDAVREAASKRPRVQAEDVPDPFGGPQSAYDDMAEAILPALDAIVGYARS